MDTLILGLVVAVYLGVIVFLGYKGYQQTQSTDDYMLAGRKAHPFVMALSYGAAFISTSAIIGFGGFAAAFGMGLLWLVFANIFFGIFIAFIFFGKPTRRLGLKLKARTFPEFLGRYYGSRLIHGFMAFIIVLFMPLYASAVLIASARFIETSFGLDYNTSVAVFSILIAVYVMCGGLKGVMYADAFQGSIMFVGMFLQILFAYGKMGGVVPTHQALDQLPTHIEADFDAVRPKLEAIRILYDQGIEKKASDYPGTVKPASDTGKEPLEQWTAGMSKRAKSWKDGARFDSITPEESSAIDQYNTLISDKKTAAAIANKIVVDKISANGFQGWTHFPVTGSKLFFVMLTSIICGVGIGALAQPQLAVRYMTVKSDRELHRAVIMGGIFICCIVGVAYLVGSLTNVWFYQQDGRIALTSVGDGNIDKIIPTFINSALPRWFGLLFMLTLLSAAMSTLSSLFHAMGCALGRDLIECSILNRPDRNSIILMRFCVLLALLATVALSFFMPPGIVAIATSTFMGLCAVSFLPLYFAALYWKRVTRAGAIASLLVGFSFSFFWMTFVQMPKGEIPALLANLIYKQPSLLGEPWRWVDVIVIALPISTVTLIVVSLLTKPLENKLEGQNRLEDKE